MRRHEGWREEMTVEINEKTGRWRRRGEVGAGVVRDDGGSR